MKQKSFADQYATLVKRLTSPGTTRERNFRTGEWISLLSEGADLVIDLEDEMLPLIDLRKTFPRTAAAEVAWYISGEQSLDLLHRYGVHIWDQFAAEDGTVETAYGYRWRRAFVRDQLMHAVQSLTNDRSNRRVYVTAWCPTSDGMMAEQANSPCPIGFTLSISGGRLNSTLLLRSSDVFVGLPYDVMGHVMLLALFAAELDVELGFARFSLAHPHLYHEHHEMAVEALSIYPGNGPPQIHLTPPDLGLFEVERVPDKLVEWYAAEADREDGRFPTFSVRPRVIP